VRIRVICGPTAGGKSSLALQLAELHNAAIISADSRQIYRGFDIGTAKPSAEDRARVAHYGIDITEPTERYSAAKWATDATRWIAKANQSGKIPLIVGGTGLYIKALFEPLSPVPSLDPERRAELEEFLAARSTDELRAWCTLLDPARAHLGKTQLIRAIETVLLTGEQISKSYERSQREETSAPTDSPDSLKMTPAYLVVDPQHSLHMRIEARVDEMLHRGWVKEVARLAETISENAPAWKSAGYSAMRDVVRGAAELASARARVIIETRQYAKRQRTWFRHQLPPERVTRLDPGDPGGDLLVQRWWHGGGVETGGGA